MFGLHLNQFEGIPLSIRREPQKFEKVEMYSLPNLSTATRWNNQLSGREKLFYFLGCQFFNEEWSSNDEVARKGKYSFIFLMYL